MRYLGLDVGGRYTGVAVSEYGGIATSLRVVDTNELQSWLVRELSKDTDTVCVIGIPRTHEHEKDNTNTDRINQLVTTLRTMNVTVVLVDESSTTGFALSLQNFAGNTARGVSSVKKSDRMDATAAAMILQRYLDTQKPRSSILDDDE